MEYDAMMKKIEELEKQLQKLNTEKTSWIHCARTMFPFSTWILKRSGLFR